MTVYEIHDEAAPRDHFTMLPNLIDDFGLSVHAYRLYGHLKRVTGENGKCWQSTDTLAQACKMGKGSVSYAKNELASSNPPLIRIKKLKKPDGRTYDEIAIIDVWIINHDHYNGKPVHPQNGVARSTGERYRSAGERKKNPLEEDPKPASSEKSKGDEPVIPLIAPKEENVVKVGLNAYDIGNWPEDVRPTLKAFCELWNFAPPALSKQSAKKTGEKRGRAADWITSLREINEAAGEYKPVDLLKAYREEVETYMVLHNPHVAPFSVTRPGSLVNAIAGTAAKIRQMTGKNGPILTPTGGFPEFGPDGRAILPGDHHE